VCAGAAGPLSPAVGWVFSLRRTHAAVMQQLKPVATEWAAHAHPPDCAHDVFSALVDKPQFSALLVGSSSAHRAFEMSGPKKHDVVHAHLWEDPNTQAACGLWYVTMGRAVPEAVAFYGTHSSSTATYDLVGACGKVGTANGRRADAASEYTIEATFAFDRRSGPPE
jgi:hypothetical protein